MRTGRVKPGAGASPHRRAVAGPRGRWPTYPTHTNVQRTLGPLGVGVLGRPRLDGEAAHPPGQRSTPVNCGSRSDACPIRSIDGEGGARSRPPWPSPSAASPSRRPPWLTGSSTRPSTAPAITSAPWPRARCSANTDNRIPMVVQANGKIVIGGSRGGSMTLVRYNAQRHASTRPSAPADSRRAQFAGTPTSGPGNSGATAMTQTPTATSSSPASARRSRWSSRASRQTAPSARSTVCFAPHLIDYTARALAVRPNGAVVLVGFARDRHAAMQTRCTLAPFVFYGQRAVVTVPATGSSTTACGASPTGKARRASRSTASATTA